MSVCVCVGIFVTYELLFTVFLCFVLFVLYFYCFLCIFILICFVSTSVRTTATE